MISRIEGISLFCLRNFLSSFAATSISVSPVSVKTEVSFLASIFRLFLAHKLKEAKNMLEKQQPIVALDHPQKPKKTRPPRNKKE